VPRVRRARARSRVLRAVILIAHAAALAVALTAVPATARPAPPAPPAAVVELNALARSTGTRRQDAIRLARVLLARTWPAQVLKVRVDGAGSHAVAGLVLSGVKFHAPLDADSFLAEVASLVRLTLASSTVEEVDVWVTVPVSVGKGAVVAGDFAQPTTRIVFSATVTRADAAAGIEALLRRGTAVFWDDSWRKTLTR
jgi:hypothetical protein